MMPFQASLVIQFLSHFSPSFQTGFAALARCIPLMSPRPAPQPFQLFHMKSAASTPTPLPVDILVSVMVQTCGDALPVQIAKGHPSSPWNKSWPKLRPLHPCLSSFPLKLDCKFF